MKRLTAQFVVAITFAAGMASAQTTFQAILSGLNEVPPNASPATGFGQVMLDAAQIHITVDESWSSLTAPATASHIHGPAPPGVNAGVLFPLSGVPAATSGSIPTQTFAITPSEVTDLFNGLYYMNVHTSTFPGGEIRGQLLLVPEPSLGVLTLLGSGVVAIVSRRRRKPACA